ncbi:MAG: ATP-binding cassette domain-containing protein [Deltaproteobacteria bacterium]|nr:ATP-binding cassette domain-containing protein [Deltaproteobacteria bacterium]
MISVQGVSKRFGAQVVLNRVSLEIEDGKTTTIVGPSGVGKSVLLKLIMGILAPDEGEVLIAGESITRARTEAERNRIRESLGVLFQSAALFDSLTVYDNVAFPLVERTRCTRKEIHSKVVRMLEALSLEEYCHNVPQEISIGIRKRVGMARALITEPKVLLFDEPNTGLDPLVGQEVYDLIKSCKELWGFTGVVISHELPEVFQVSDKIAMLLNGKVIEEGSPQQLASSANPAVQQFLNGRVDGPIKIQ